MEKLKEVTIKKKKKKHVFTKLIEHLNQKIIGIGCAAHILHNTIQTASDLLPVDVEKMYSYFSIYILCVLKV